MSGRLILFASGGFAGDTLSVPSLEDQGVLGGGPLFIEGDYIEVPSLEDQGVVGDGPLFVSKSIQAPSLGDAGRVGDGPLLLVDDGDGGFEPPGADPTSRLKVRYFADTAALAAGGTGLDLNRSMKRSFRHRPTAVGAWTFEVRKDDPNRATLEDGGIVRFDLDGLPVFAGPIDFDDFDSLNTPEGRGQHAKFSGRSLVSLFGDVTVAGHTPDGARFFDDVRAFDWRSPELDTSGWPTAFALYSQNTTDPDYPTRIGQPRGWPDGDAQWIWSEYDANQPPLFDPAISYFHDTFEVADDDTIVSVYLACDDAFVAAIDGIIVGANGTVHGWKQPYRVDVPLDAGTHTLRVKAENYDRAAATNSAGLLYDIYAQDNAGDDATLLLRSTGDARCLHNPANPPGFTDTQIIGILLDEWEAAGELATWVRTFGDVNDSNGNPMPVGQQRTFRVGQSGLEVLEQLGETSIDYDTGASGLVLHVWRAGEGGVSESAASVDLSTDLQGLTFDREYRPVTSLRVRFAGGWTVVTDAAAVASYGFRQEPYSLGNVEGLADARAIATAELARLSSPKERIRLVPNEQRTLTGRRPYTDWRPPDFVIGPTRAGGTSPVRVRELQVEQVDENGAIVVTPTLNSLKEEIATRLLRSVKAMTPGSLDGRSLAVSLPRPAESVTVRRVVTEAGEFGFQGAPLEDFIDVAAGPYPWEQSGRLVSITYRAQAGPVSGSPATFVGKVDGVTVFTWVVASGVLDDELPLSVEVDRAEDLTITPTAAAEETEGVTLKAYLLAFV